MSSPVPRRAFISKHVCNLIKLSQNRLGIRRRLHEPRDNAIPNQERKILNRQQHLTTRMPKVDFQVLIQVSFSLLRATHLG
jgi:hypothetical protein